MAKLKALPQRLGMAGPKLAQAPKTAESFYTSPEWRGLREAKKAQGQVWCVDCGSNKRLILDHDKERKDGGADLPPLDELKWRCWPCHNRKTAEARRKRALGEAGK